MTWDGIERRHEPLHSCKYEGKIMDMHGDIQEIKNEVNNLSKRINGSMDAISEHIEQGAKWRMAIVASAVTIVIQAVVVSFYLGVAHNQMGHLTEQTQELKQDVVTADLG